MKIFINEQPVHLPNDYMTLDQLIKWKSVKEDGTAIALNNKIVTREQWPNVKLKDGDLVTIISAAFGG